MNNSQRDIYVYADWTDSPNPLLMGTFHAERKRGNETFSFEYEKLWLESEYAADIDPDLHLYHGQQFVLDPAKINFGVFTDSCPDRWGRILMHRREVELAKRENRIAKSFFESDYLLGVYDLNRMGALRFKTDINGEFQNSNHEMAAPPWASIRELQDASLRLESDNSVDQPDYLNLLNMLIAPGSSLGGARPKAGIVDDKGHPWIAKFPSKNDEFNIGAWEIVVNELAQKAGLNVAECMAIKVSNKYHTFLSKRFDRTKEGNRLHFASAMTLLGYRDGLGSKNGESYLELAEFITRQGVKVKEDLIELWSRIVFNVCISNTDDHLRNHGFILDRGGWSLSPVYDINPIYNGRGLSLNIDEKDNSLSLDLALEVCEYFELNKIQAREIISRIQLSVQNWKPIAQKYGISRAEQELMGTAFTQSGIVLKG